MHTVDDPGELRDLVGEPGANARDKVRTALHAIDRQWLAVSRFCLLATAGADGRCDVSPKGDPAGSTLVLDERTIVLADRPGNRRVDGLLNILANPQIGLIFLIGGRGDTLRINGRARIVRDAEWFARLEAEGRRPPLAILVEVEEVFYHCSKSFLRSTLWQPDSWRPDDVPSRAQISHALERPETSLAELEEYYGPTYGTSLYG